MTTLPTDDSRAHWAALHDRWKPIPTRPGYVVVLVVVTGLVLLLPLVYFGLIAGMSYGLYWHVRFNAPELSGTSPRAALVSITIYVSIAIAGLVLILGLLKPIVAFAYDSTEVKLEPFEELKLHSYVENVCALIGAPPPKEITIDCSINAGAGLRRGLLSLFIPGDLRLHIGMPLVAGLSKREFAGVLAHEFGHFSQGAGMRLTEVVQSIGAWFTRLAYTPDAWTLRLEIAAERTANAWLGLAAMFVAIVGWLVRVLLMGLAFAAGALGALVLRQMEYDADRYEVQLAGSRAFTSTMHRLARLAAAQPIAIEDSRRMFLRAGELPDNLPAVIAGNAEALSPEDRAAVDKSLAEQRTGWLDSHPSFRDRARAAEAFDQPGLLTDDSPARDLFQDFDRACKRASGAFFRSILGPYFIDARPVSARQGLRAGVSSQAQASTLGAYLGFEPLSWRPIFPPIRAVAPLGDPKPVIERIKTHRTESRRLAAQAAAGAAKFRDASEEAARWERVRHLMDAGFGINFKSIKLTSTTRHGVSFKLDELKARTVEGADALDDAADHAMARLAASLSLLGWDGLARLLPDAPATRARANLLLGALTALHDSLRSAREARHISGVIADLDHLAGRPAEDKLKTFIRLTSDRLRDVLDDARRSAGGAPDPFALADAPANLGETLVGASPAWRDFDEIFTAGHMLAQRQPEVYQAVMGELVDIALRVERALAQAVVARKREDAVSR